MSKGVHSYLQYYIIYNYNIVSIIVGVLMSVPSINMASGFVLMYVPCDPATQYNIISLAY